MLAAALSRRPALLEAASGAVPEGARLEFPFLHAALAPLSILGDLLACQSARASLALLAFLLTAGFPFYRFFFAEPDLSRWWERGRGLRAFGKYFAALLLLLAWALALPRPIPRLVVDDPETLVVDFHSHTSASWDGRRSFTPERSARWHERAGFHAAFVTDHNVFAAAARAHGMSRLTRERGRAFVALEGEELTLHGAHVVALGNRALIDSKLYDDGLPGLERFLREARAKHGALAVMSLPEYDRHHRDRLELLADWGAAGFELVSASPRGLAIPSERRAAVAELCRRRNLLAVGSTDNHGWGGSACVWNLARLPGWRALDPDALQARLLAALSSGGFSAVRVAERPRRDTPSGLALCLHPVFSLFDALRRLTPLHWFFTLVWIGAGWLFSGLEGKIRAQP